MRNRARAATLILTALLLGAFSDFDLRTYAQAQSPGGNPAPTATRKGAAMTQHATGPFDVKVNPQTPDGKFEDATMGRMTIDKQFHGDLEGTSKGVCWRPQPASKAQPAMSPWKRSREL